MRYTPLQVREVVGITEETLRHWRKVLLPIANRNGYRPCFTAGDILAIRIVRELVDKLHVNVKAMSSVSRELFKICQAGSWARLESSLLLIDPASARIELKDHGDALSLETPALVMPLARLIAELQERLMHDVDLPQQSSLALPPVALETGSKG